MPRHRLHPSDKRELLSRLVVDCYTLDQAAESLGLTRAVALDVVSHHGYPDPDRMLRAIDALQNAIDRGDVPAPKPAPPAAVTRHVTPEKEAVVTPSKGIPPEDEWTPDEDVADPNEDLEVVPVLLLEARKSPAKRVVNRAARVQEDIDWLRRQVIAERAERANAEEIDRLERRLAELRGRDYVDGRQRSKAASVIPEVTCHQVAPREFAGCPFPPTTSLQGLNTHRRRAHNLPALTRDQIVSLVEGVES